MRADIKTVGLLGGGVIGAGWAARCALNGHDVRVCDLDPEAERKLDEVMTNARRAWSRLTLAPLPAAGSIRVVRTIEEAADGADFIQESLPEQEALKIFAARAGGQDRAARCGDRVLDLGVAALAPAVGPGASRAPGGRPPLQPSLPDAACRGLRRGAHRRGHEAKRGGFLPVAWHASADAPQGSRRLRRRPAHGGALAREALVAHP